MVRSGPCGTTVLLYHVYLHSRFFCLTTQSATANGLRKAAENGDKSEVARLLLTATIDDIHYADQVCIYFRGISHFVQCWKAWTIIFIEIYYKIIVLLLLGWFWRHIPLPGRKQRTFGDRSNADKGGRRRRSDHWVICKYPTCAQKNINDSLKFLKPQTVVSSITTA